MAEAGGAAWTGTWASVKAAGAEEMPLTETVAVALTLPVVEKPDTAAVQVPVVLDCVKAVHDAPEAEAPLTASVTGDGATATRPSASAAVYSTVSTV